MGGQLNYLEYYLGIEANMGLYETDVYETVVYETTSYEVQLYEMSIIWNEFYEMVYMKWIYIYNRMQYWKFI